VLIIAAVSLTRGVLCDRGWSDRSKTYYEVSNGFIFMFLQPADSSVTRVRRARYITSPHCERERMVFVD
jgi:hypothetical protein